MRKTIASTSLIAVTLLTALAVLAPATASAREGSARSIGNGVKCYTAGVVQADGTVKYQRVCYKGV
jgi:ABC-type sugar transport system substrate-binding protein